MENQLCENPFGKTFSENLLSFSNIRKEHERIYHTEAFPSAADRESIESFSVPNLQFVGGIDKLPDGTDGERPRYTIVSGCVVKDVGLFNKAASFIQFAKQAMTTLRGNVLFNGPRDGVNFNGEQRGRPRGRGRWRGRARARDDRREKVEPI